MADRASCSLLETSWPSDCHGERKKEKIAYYSGGSAGEASHRESSDAVLSVVADIVAPRDRHVVYDPVVLVVQAHSALQSHQALLAVRLPADVRARAYLGDISRYSFCYYRQQESNSMNLPSGISLPSRTRSCTVRDGFSHRTQLDPDSRPVNCSRRSDRSRSDDIRMG